MHTHPKHRLLCKQLRALCNERRMRIVRLLAASAMTLSEIAADLHIRLQYASRHVRILQDAGVVEGSKKGRHVFFRMTKRARSSALLMAVVRAHALVETGEK